MNLELEELVELLKALLLLRLVSYPWAQLSYILLDLWTFKIIGKDYGPQFFTAFLHITMQDFR